MLKSNCFPWQEQFLECSSRWEKARMGVLPCGLLTCKVLHIDICTLDDELLDAPGISSDGSSMQPSLSPLVSLIYFIFGFGGRVRSSLLTNCGLRGMLWCCVNCREERNSQEFQARPKPLEGALATRFVLPLPRMLPVRQQRRQRTACVCRMQILIAGCQSPPERAAALAGAAGDPMI